MPRVSKSSKSSPAKGKSGEKSKDVMKGKGEIKPTFNKNTLWKLVRQSACPTIQFRLCSVCSNVLYYDQEKFQHKKGNRIEVRFVLCSKCVEKNMDISDMTDGKNGHFARNNDYYKKDKQVSKKEEEASESDDEETDEEKSEDDE